MSKPANTAVNRKLRSDGPVDEDAESEVMFKTPNGRRSRSTSRSDSERTLNSEDTLSTSEQNGEGDDDIGVISVERVTVNADVTGDAERSQAALNRQATPFVPASGLMPVPPPAMDPTLQYMMSMMAQMQEQARYDRAEAARLAREQVLRAEQAQEQARLENLRLQEQARLDNLRLQEQIVALQRDRASAPKTTHLRTGKPPQFDLENDKRKFAVWKSKWGYYVESSGIADLTGINKTRTMRAELTLALSDETISWINNEDITPEQREDTNFVIKRMEEYIKGSTSPLVAVADALKIKQLTGMSAEAFIKALKEQIKMCDLDKIDNVKEWFSILCVCHNVQSSEVRTKLLLTKDLTFQMAVDIIMEEEKAAKTAKQMPGGSADPYANATSQHSSDHYEGDKNSFHRNRSESRDRNERPSSGGTQGQNWLNCNRCGKSNHKPTDRRCHAKDAQCDNCGRIGHYARVCWSQNRMDHHGEVNSINIDASESIDAEDPTLDLIEVELTGDDGRPIKVLALPDTGANITAISQEVWERTRRELSPIWTPTRSADGKVLNAIGKTRYVIEYQERRVETEVEVVQGLTTMVLSLNVLKGLGIVSASFPHLKEDQTETDSANEFQTERETQNPKTFEKEEREGVKVVMKSPKHSKRKKGKERKRLRKAQTHKQF